MLRCLSPAAFSAVLQAPRLRLALVRLAAAPAGRRSRREDPKPPVERCRRARSATTVRIGAALGAALKWSLAGALLRRTSATCDEPAKAPTWAGVCWAPARAHGAARGLKLVDKLQGEQDRGRCRRRRRARVNRQERAVHLQWRF